MAFLVFALFERRSIGRATLPLTQKCTRLEGTLPPAAQGPSDVTMRIRA
jgi:hypothetical protein